MTTRIAHAEPGAQAPTSPIGEERRFRTSPEPDRLPELFAMWYWHHGYTIAAVKDLHEARTPNATMLLPSTPLSRAEGAAIPALFFCASTSPRFTCPRATIACART